MPERQMVWNVDKSYSNYRGSKLNGDLPPSEKSKYHLDSGDTTAKCSPRVLLNSMPGDVGEWLDTLSRDEVCRKCVPELPADVEVRRHDV